MIEVGEYAKIKEWNVIGKILEVTPRKVYIDNLGFPLTREQIAKHSKNIIDLIEAGDYVNGYLVTSVDERANTIYVLDGMYEYPSLYINERIKSVVTKEQFAQAEYKVKEDK